MRDAIPYAAARAGAPAGAPAASEPAAARRRGPLLAAAALLAPALAFLLLQLAVPSDGSPLRPGDDTATTDGLRIAPLPGVDTGLRDGDLVTAVGGVPVATLAGQAFRTRDPAPEVAALRERWNVGATVDYRLVRDGAARTVPVTLIRYPLMRAAARTWGMIVFALVSAVVATLVFARRPERAAARVLFVSAAALTSATTWSLGLQVADVVHGAGLLLFGATTVAAFMVYWSTLLHFALVFPTPLAGASARWLVPATYLAPPVLIALGLAGAGRVPHDPLELLGASAAPTAVHAAVMLTLALAAAVAQYRRQRSEAGRRQLRWVVFAALVAGGAGLALYLLPPLLGLSAAGPNVTGVLVTAFPVAVAIAVLRHALFDIDVLLNRTLVYGLLTFGVVAAYAAIVAVAGAMLPRGEGALPALLVAAVAAVLVQPLRDRIQRLVNRLMYGDRDDPTAVLARLGERLESTLAPDAILPTLVETVAETLKLPSVVLTLDEPGASRVAASFGAPADVAVRFPLVHRGERLGELAVAPRSSEEPFTSTELDLLDTIATQAGVAAFAVRASDDLRRSRERLVAAREEERRRLRRDLHDGIGPTLGGLAMRLDAAANLLGERDEAARARLLELREQVETAIAELRRVVHALRPPALDDLGLVAALREQVARARSERLATTFDAPHALPEMPAAVELAAYRIAQEALANVVRHADARSCHVSIVVGDDLSVVVDDDGVGVAGAARGRPRADGSGVGLASMRERAAELGGALRIGPKPGGGTRLVARLPLRVAGGDGGASS
jgi:signal transduction histidine kinase